MPWYGIRNVKQIEIRLINPDPKAKDLFYGVYQPADKALETRKQKLLESMSTFSPDPDPDPDPDPFDDLSEFDPCWYDHKRGFTVQREGCDHHIYGGYGDDPDLGIPPCPVGEFHKDEERLTRLEMEPLRTLLFQNPKMAVYNELDNAGLVYSSR